MLRLLAYLIGKGVVTKTQIPEMLNEGLIGMPKVNSVACESDCDKCVSSCPTSAIKLTNGTIQLDRGACIGCGECLTACPTGTLTNDLTTKTFTYTREDLMQPSLSVTKPENQAGIFSASLALRVVSTGCSACDLEVAAAGNPIFDVERFGINVVASPRFADALLITGPVPKAMHEPLRIAYEAMAAPKIVIACGTCAISGGVHRDGYTEANGGRRYLARRRVHSRMRTTSLANHPGTSRRKTCQSIGTKVSGVTTLSGR